MRGGRASNRTIRLQTLRPVGATFNVRTFSALSVFPNVFVDGPLAAVRISQRVRPGTPVVRVTTIDTVLFCQLVARAAQ